MLGLGYSPSSYLYALCESSSSQSHDTLTSSTMLVPSEPRNTCRLSSKRRISDSEREVTEEGPVDHGRKAKKEKKGKQVTRPPSGRYMTRSHDKKKA